MSKKRYKINMRRGKLRVKLLTHALSKDQARHFARYRKPGYRVTRVREDGSD